jgi:hypothetical protein
VTVLQLRYGQSDLDSVTVLRSDVAFQRYINAGGNFVGIHGASASSNSTAFVRELGTFLNNPRTILFRELRYLQPGSKFDYHARLQPFVSFI